MLMWPWSYAGEAVTGLINLPRVTAAAARYQDVGDAGPAAATNG